MQGERSQDDISGVFRIRPGDALQHLRVIEVRKLALIAAGNVLGYLGNAKVHSPVFPSWSSSI
jgi:hypothetical protein